MTPLPAKQKTSLHSKKKSNQGNYTPERGKMAITVLLIGKSGSGKSASLRNFKPEELDIINVEGKPLPFRNNFETINTDDYKSVAVAVKNSTKPSIVIDDAGYLITNQFMRGHSSAGSGNAIFTFYNNIADTFWKLITFIKGNGVSAEKIVYIFMHEDQNDFGQIKPKTIGKLLDEKVSIEGMFTIVLRSVYHDGGYYFRTKTDGLDVCKTPIGMFDSDEIPNDLKAVDVAIREYYGLTEG
jgi:hypothetical protein